MRYTEELEAERQVDIFLEGIRQARERQDATVLGNLALENINQVNEEVEETDE